MNKDIFISYSSLDKKFAVTLHDNLEQWGYLVWRDERDIDCGEYYPKAIKDALCACHCIVIILSTSSTNSTWVQEELEQALKLKIPIFPILLENINYDGVFSRICGLQAIGHQKVDLLKGILDKKLLIEEKFVSSSETIFLNSDPVNLVTQQGPRQSIEVYNNLWNNLGPHYLSAKRIAATAVPSDSEAKHGGEYNFQHMVDISCNISLIRQAELFVWVDDECSVAVDGQNLGTAFNTPSGQLRKNINISCLQRQTIFNFKVTNYSWKHIGGVGYPSGQNNPYGLAYLIIVRSIIDSRISAPPIANPVSYDISVMDNKFDLKLGPRRPVSNLHDSVLLLHVNCRLFLNLESIRIRNGQLVISNSSVSELNDLKFDLDYIGDNVILTAQNNPLYNLESDAQVWLTFRYIGGSISQREGLKRANYNLQMSFQTNKGVVELQILNTVTDLIP